MKVATKMSLAMAAAALFMSAPVAFAQDAVGGETGHCVGSNSCKGHSACKGANNACKGQNACKGKGFEEKTKAECEKAGGKFEAAAK